MYQSETTEAYLQSANTFERIALAEADHWEPVYYAAYSYIFAGMLEQDPAKKDLLLDKALDWVSKGEAMQLQDAEFAVLKGWTYSQKISVDPSVRGQQYSQLAYVEIYKAIQMSPDNPRAAFMKASMDYGTAQFFGNDTSAICAQFDKAQELAANETTQSELWPVWATHAIASYQQQCK